MVNNRFWYTILLWFKLKELTFFQLALIKKAKKNICMNLTILDSLTCLANLSH